MCSARSSFVSAEMLTRPVYPTRSAQPANSRAPSTTAQRRRFLSVSGFHRDTVRNANGQAVQRTVKNKELKMTFAELDKHLEDLLKCQGNRCALTGIPFHFKGPDADKYLLPSADRIDSNGHYERGNIQVVCQLSISGNAIPIMRNSGAAHVVRGPFLYRLTIEHRALVFYTSEIAAIGAFCA